MKRCGKCGEDKVEKDFLASKNDHLRSECRMCRKIKWHMRHHGLSEQESKAKVEDLDLIDVGKKNAKGLKNAQKIADALNAWIEHIKGMNQ